MMSGKEQRQAVQAALQQLPRLERELIYRRYFLEQRVEEAADALNLTRQAADNRLWRARKALRELLVVPGREEVSHGE
jgi:RNA polymerase sigma-70 factor (ECF subfamily)